MSDLKVYGHIISQPVKSVLAFLKLSNIEYTFEVVDLLNGGNLKEEYTQINPYQAVPAIVHNGFNVWESAAIIAYIAESYNVDNQWYPKDLKIRARINAYFHWHHQNTREPIMNFLIGKMLAPKLYGKPELTEEQEVPLRAAVNEFLGNLKWTIASTRYVARSEHPTIADIFAFNELAPISGLVNLDEHPEVKSWFLEIAAIPAVKELSDQSAEVVAKILG